MNQVSSNEISELLHKNIHWPPTIADEMKPEVFSFKIGEKRSLETIFAPIKGAFVSEIRIEDPYCGSKLTMSKLQDLLSSLASLPEKCDNIHIICKELSYNDMNYRSSNDINHSLHILAQTYFQQSKIKTTVIDFKKSKFFHDRSIIISLLTPSGEELKHRFDLSGGIDYLLDSAKETKIYHYLENK